MNARRRAFGMLTACFLVLGASGPAWTDPPCDGGLEACLQAGEQLYRTHHLAPGLYEEAIRLYEQGLAMRPDHGEPRSPPQNSSV